MADAQFKIGDTVSVFEGTHHVRGRRSMSAVGKFFQRALHLH